MVWYNICYGVTTISFSFFCVNWRVRSRVVQSATVAYSREISHSGTRAWSTVPAGRISSKYFVESVPPIIVCLGIIVHGRLSERDPFQDRPDTSFVQQEIFLPSANRRRTRNIPVSLILIPHRHSTFHIGPKHWAWYNQRSGNNDGDRVSVSFISFWSFDVRMLLFWAWIFWAVGLNVESVLRRYVWMLFEYISSRYRRFFPVLTTNSTNTARVTPFPPWIGHRGTGHRPLAHIPGIPLPVPSDPTSSTNTVRKKVVVVRCRNTRRRTPVPTHGLAIAAPSVVIYPASWQFLLVFDCLLDVGLFVNERQ